MDLNKITIVIPTYNRPKYIQRSVRFWSSTGVDLIVVDGSEEQIEQNWSKLGGRIRYFHSPKSIADRLELILGAIDTPFVLMFSDDEFVSISALRKSVDFLLGDAQFGACGGICIRFDLQNGVVVGDQMYPEFKGRILQHPDPYYRSVQHMLTYVPMCIYSPARTSLWVRVMKACCDARRQLKQMDVFELTFEILMTASSKVLTLPNLYWFRSGENDGVRPEAEVIHHDFLRWWYDTSNGRLHQSTYLNILGDALQDLTSLNQQDALKLAYSAVEAYISWRGFYDRILYKTQHPAHRVYFPCDITNQCRKIEAEGIDVNWDDVYTVSRAISDSGER
jgi:glycosyltransferase domain-containing protein